MTDYMLGAGTGAGAGTYGERNRSQQGQSKINLPDEQEPNKRDILVLAAGAWMMLWREPAR